MRNLLAGKHFTHCTDMKICRLALDGLLSDYLFGSILALESGVQTVDWITS
jgi:hypothetical protein